MRCNNFNCEYMQLNGCCSKTACSQPITNVKENIVYTYKDNCIIFPQTIGNRTFYTKQELIDYVLMQQDEDYGRGNWC